MMMPKRCKIEGCANRYLNSHSAKYCIDHVYLDVKKKVVVATDGKCLASVPVGVDDTDTSGLLSVQSMKYARGITHRFGDTHLRCEKSITMVDDTTMPRPAVENKIFPNYEALIPIQEPICEINIDVELLLKIAKAIGERFIKIKFYNETAVLKIEPVDKHNPDLFGLLMPYGP